MVWAVLNVFQFEFRRSLTRPRITLWALLVGFPCLLIALMRFGSLSQTNDEFLVVVLYVLIPQLTCMLSLLLWMTPAVQSELEASTWTYVAVRPNGRRAMLLGKYLNAVLWTAATTTASLTFAVLIASPIHLTQTYGVLLVMCLISSACYGALYALIAVAIPHRSMIVALVYTIVVEYLIGYVPAVINQVTFSFRLRVLFVRWMGWDNIPAGLSAITDSSHYSIVHLLMILVVMCVYGGVAIYVLERRQFVASDHG